jgi:hypothetical protein
MHLTEIQHHSFLIVFEELTTIVGITILAIHTSVLLIIYALIILFHMIHTLKILQFVLVVKWESHVGFHFLLKTIK